MNSLAVSCKQREWRFIFDTVRPQPRIRDGSCRARVIQKLAGVHVPIELPSGGEMGHRFALDQRRPRPAKGIENPLTTVDSKPLEIRTDEMGRKRKDEPIPVVHTSIC